MIDFTKQPIEIAEEIISYYESNTQYFDGYKYHKPFKITCVRLAIDKVTDLIDVCVVFDSKLNIRPDYKKLQSVLEILNSKIK